jgi:hypothetical protein
LSGDLIPASAELGRVELYYDSSGFENDPFVREELRDATSIAGGDVDLIGFNRTGNALRRRGVIE